MLAMVSNPRMEGGIQMVSAEVRKTIRCLREVVSSHSDAEIYLALKESNMDPDEAVQKLLNQDPFQEVKRRNDRRKEPPSAGYKGSADSRRHSENINQRMNFRARSDHNTNKLSYSRNKPGINQEFSVSDNRLNHNISKEVKPSAIHCTISTNDQLILNTSKKGSVAASGNRRSSGAGNFSQDSNVPSDSHAKYSGHSVLNGSDRKDTFVEKQSMTLNAKVPAQAVKPNNAQQNSAKLITTSSAVGIYSSVTDPVHEPSPDSRSSGLVRAIRRDVGVVGAQCQSSDNSVKQSSVPSSSYANSLMGKDSISTDSSQSFGPILRNEQFSQSSVTESSIPAMPVSRPFLNNQYNSGPHQQLVGHPRASQPNEEWKPKSSQKSNSKSPEVIGMPKKDATPPAENYLESDKANVDDKLSQLNLHGNQNVIIAQHICVPETDRCQLTFGTIGAELDSSMHQSKFRTIETIEKSDQETTGSFPVLAPESSSDDVSGNKEVDLQDDHSNNTGFESLASGAASEQQSPDNRESSSLQNLNNYPDIGLVRDGSPSYAPPELQQQQQQQYSHDMPGFSGYDPPSGYELPHFRPTIDEAVGGHCLPSPQEGLISHASNGITASTIAMVKQQQPPVVQMHPQVHVPHLANVMPFRQYGSPVYVPSMAMPGYSSNVPYHHHPSNASSYLLVSGGSSHHNANNHKYGVRQFKPVPAGNRTGYAINGPDGVGGATSPIDASRMKYKNSNLYVRHPQAETTEIWIQNPRELPSMQSAPFYNLTVQTPHAAYMPSNTGHASFNAAAAHSSHMHFPSMYHPSPQLAAAAATHQLGRPAGSNAATAAQLGAYQQPQLGHPNWTTNF